MSDFGRILEDYERRFRALERRMENKELAETPSQESLARSNAISMALVRPGLRGLWCAASANESGNVPDLSGQGRTLTNSGVTYGQSGSAPRGAFVASGSRYWSRADEAGLDITGTEALNATAQRGLTLDGWFMPLAAGAGLVQSYAGKFNTTGSQGSYLLAKDASNQLQFIISVDGSTQTTVTGPVITFDAWHHVACRFVPSTSLDIFVNGVKYSNTTSIPASIFAGTANLNVGARNNGGTAYADMLVSTLGLYCMQHSDAMIQAYCNHTRALFGV